MLKFVWLVQEIQKNITHLQTKEHESLSLTELYVVEENAD